MSQKRLLNPGGRKGPGMSAGVVASGFIFLAGQVAIDENGKLIGEGDVGLQTEQCFRNIERILAEAGATLADVVEMTCFLAKAEYAATFLGIRAQKFANDPPATTSVVAALLDPRLLVELKAVAQLPNR
jgi:enamine deaminase RidA (YjgF/YER057c/UK114 family)